MISTTWIKGDDVAPPLSSCPADWLVVQRFGCIDTARMLAAFRPTTGDWGAQQGATYAAAHGTAVRAWKAAGTGRKIMLGFRDDAQLRDLFRGWGMLSSGGRKDAAASFLATAEHGGYDGVYLDIENVAHDETTKAQRTTCTNDMADMLHAHGLAMATYGAEYYVDMFDWPSWRGDWHDINSYDMQGQGSAFSQWRPSILRTDADAFVAAGLPRSKIGWGYPAYAAASVGSEVRTWSAVANAAGAVRTYGPTTGTIWTLSGVQWSAADPAGLVSAAGTMGTGYKHCYGWSATQDQPSGYGLAAAARSLPQ